MATARAEMDLGSPVNTNADPWPTAARALGWFSIALGATELLAPRALGAVIGIDRPGTLRALGARELLSGAGILSQPGRPAWMWSRVAGDAMDLALLALALRSRNTGRGRIAAAAGAVALVAAADVLCSRAVSRRATPVQAGPLVLHASIAIQRPAEELYRCWRELTNLPRFMMALREVSDLGERRSHWVAAGPAGIKLEWDAEVTNEQPNELIGWRVLQGSLAGMSGNIRFERAAAEQGTLVHLHVRYAGTGRTAARLIRTVTNDTLKQQLRRFKQLMETGEVATTAGQPTGQRSKVVRLFNRVGLQ